MQEIILNNDLSIQISADNPINLDFSAGDWDTIFQSPNLNFIQSYLAEFRTISDDSRNPVKFITDFWQENGINTPLPTKIVDGDITVVDGYIDIMSTDNYIDQFDGNFSTLMKFAVVEKRKSLEQQLQGVKTSTFFGYEIKKSDLVEVVAVLNSVPDNGAAAMLAIALTTTAIQAVDVVQRITSTSAKAATTPLFGLSAAGAGSWVTIDAISDGIVLTGYAVTFGVLAKQLDDNLIGDQKYYNAVRVKTVLTAIFSSLGYGFQSTIFEGEYADYTIIAPTDNSGSKTRGKASNNPIPDQTGLEFLSFVCDQFNATLKVYENNVVRLERKDYFFDDSNTEVVLPDLMDNGIKKFNYSELYSNISINYQRDPSDGNSISGARRGITVSFSRPNSSNVLAIGNNRYSVNTLSRSKNVNINYARVSRKNSLSRVEGFYNELTKPLKKLGANIQDLTDRRGAMQISNFNLNTGVAFMYSNNKIDKDNDYKLDPKTLYDNFHSIDSPEISQYFIHERTLQTPIPLSDFKKLQYNNVARDENGNSIYIQQNVKDSKTGLFDITYRQKIPTNSLFYFKYVDFVQEFYTKE